MAIRTRNLDTKVPPRYRHYTFTLVAASDAGINLAAQPLAQWGFNNAGQIVDVIFRQDVAGAAGTDVSFSVLKNGTAVCSTLAKLKQAAGAAAQVDAKAELSLPTNCVRPIIKSDGTQNLAKGDVLTVTTTHTGTYSGTFPTLYATVVVDSKEY